MEDGLIQSGLAGTLRGHFRHPNERIVRASIVREESRTERDEADNNPCLRFNAQYDVLNEDLILS